MLHACVRIFDVPRKIFLCPFLKEKKALLCVLACPTCTQKKFLQDNIRIQLCSGKVEISIHESPPYLNIQVLHSFIHKIRFLVANYDLTRVFKKYEKAIALPKWIKGMP